MFYKIQKEGKTAGYLLGTMHIGNELLINLNPKIRKALSKSKIIAGEEPIDIEGKCEFVPKKG
ncbi:MAG: TraB/GumN family protein [Parachlamydiaceae bacterium]|nr:MAG: TraB/GumN family protein [Parachlamydiaceae bacterium]